MKNRIVLCLLLAAFNIASAQSFDSALRYRMLAPSFSVAADTLIARAAAASPTDTSEASKVNSLAKFTTFMRNRISLDVPLGSDMYAPMSSALSAYSYYVGSCPAAGNWQPVGPFTSYYGTPYGDVEHQGRINAIWANPTRDSSILAAADGGGLWKSVNDGWSWHCITDFSAGGTLAMPGITCLAVDPLDTNTIYMVVGTSGQDTKGGYSLGLVYTTDGGSHWYTDTAFTDTAGWGHSPEVQKIAYMPGTEQLFAISATKALYKASPADTWHNITAPTMNGRWLEDLEFSLVSNTAIISTQSFNHYASLFKWNSGTWTEMVMNLPGTTISPYCNYGLWDWEENHGNKAFNNGAVQFSMTGTDSAVIVFLATDTLDSASAVLLIKTPITSFEPTPISMNFPGVANTGVTKFIVSPSNSNIVYAANYDGWDGDAIYMSTNGGQNFYSTGYTHADGRCLYVYSTTNTTNGINDEVFLGTDGGIRKKKPTSNNFDCITGDSLTVTEFYGFGNTEADENIMAGGAQDVGGFSYIKSRTNPWNWEEDGDGYQAKFMKNGITNSFGEGDRTNYNELYALYFSGSTDYSGGYDEIADPAPISVPINRKLFFNQENEAYIGYAHMYEMPYSSGSWQRAFLGGDPIDMNSHTPKDVCDFDINEQDSNNVYIAYGGAALGASSLPLSTNDTFGRLYFSTNAHYPTPSWQNITPSLCLTNQINSICVDPQHSNRIWVAFGNVNTDMVGADPATMTKRVLYSNNSGASWTDVSAGLSALPVNKILYRKGSNDEIYAGTDVGVFQWNPGTNSWQCFNSGLPACIVMDMEMNYCAGKLRVATYGRGIWETPVGNITPLPDTATTVITDSTTWNQNMWLENSVTVMAGGTLIITNDTIHMPRMGVIAVEPGGHLIVNHAEITNSCNFCWWKGIEARGTCWLPQSAINQGWVTIEGGSTIQHAVTGVRNSDVDVVWSTDGGIIQANGSYFVDNVSDADFDAYDNWHGATLQHNLSTFVQCVFLQDNNYKGNTPGFTLENMVNLHSVEGVTFSGCQFLNRDTFAISRLIGEAIDAVNSDFYVSAACPSSSPLYLCLTPSIRSRFCGFTNAIMIHGLFQPGLAPNIDNADFDSVSVGVNVATFSDVTTTRCNFAVGHGLSVGDVSSPAFTGCYQNIGILLQACPQFKMEGNNFIGKPNLSLSDWYNFGTVVSNTGGFTNTVYRNSFDTLTYGVYTTGINNDYGMPHQAGKGLKIFCNNFLDNSCDIYVNSSGLPLASYGGISVTQGTPIPGSTTFTSAANTFSTLSTENICNYGANIDYYYNSGVTAEYPFHTCAPITPPLSGNIYLHATDSSNSCPSSFSMFPAPYWGGVTIEPLGLTGHKQNFYNNRTAYQDSIAVYNSLIDFGNTDSMINVINGSRDTSTLYSTLSNGSPYISVAALESVGSLSKLPYYSMLQLLKQNPDDLRKGYFLPIMQAEYNFSTADFDTLIAASTNTTRRTNLEVAMNGTIASMANEATTILLALKTPIDTNLTITADSTWSGICTDSTSVYYLLDSNTIYLGLDSIDTWLQNTGELWASYDRVGYHNFRNGPDDANNIFNNIGNSLPAGSSPDTAAYITYGKVWNAIYDAESAGGNLYSLNSSEIASLDTSSTPAFTYNSGLVMINGITALVNPTNTNYTFYPCVSVSLSGGKHGVSGTNTPPPITNIGSGNNQFSAYPNPTSGVVTFSYNVPDAGGNMKIVISNIMGEAITQIEMVGKSGNVYWDSRNLAAGVYLYQASSDKGIISKGKLVVIK